MNALQWMENHLKTLLFHYFHSILKMNLNCAGGNSAELVKDGTV